MEVHPHRSPCRRLSILPNSQTLKEFDDAGNVAADVDAVQLQLQLMMLLLMTLLLMMLLLLMMMM
ncbi:hypothetical protein DPMN_159116 [Dreissena polymorpha]|uniref:Uncharacterized protein n=1 Tax=Dreissena polymorpha TaxID=45954 RepID=A0A9D4EKZ5_DREPO|nr:hypothetical protein DPMN_159116 [Dreissena polymorpha]